MQSIKVKMQYYLLEVTEVVLDQRYLKLEIHFEQRIID